MHDVFADAIEQLLSHHCPPQQVRRIEAGGDGGALWSELLASGFADALVPEAAGGAGLTTRECFPIVFACGYHALPLPFAQTLLVRGLLARAQETGTVSCPQGPIAIADHSERCADGAIRCARVSFGGVAQWILAELDDTAFLLPVAAASRSGANGHAVLSVDLCWSSLPPDAREIHGVFDCRVIGAAIHAALLAGAQQRVLTMTLAYANDRSQFGKAIGKFQAIQQQLSVLAEQVYAAKMAAQIGFDDALVPAPLKVAVAKARASEAATTVAATAHAIHGAMGFTEEYDLQLYTRRLHEWRMACGSESYWYHRLGDAARASTQRRAVDFVREDILAGRA